MQFVHQTLTWGFLLALVPLLIHLINLVRRQRVRWAAMDFLLQSYRKHRTWIWLQQLLLLLLRMAAVAVIVAMLAQWITQRERLALFGGTATHHYVLLDDSFSMSEQFGGTSAFDVAEQAIGRLAAQAMRQETQQKVTLIRFSRAAQADSRQSAGQIADLNSEIVDNQFDVFVSEKLRQFDVSQTASGPHAALQVLRQLLEVGLEEQNLVYVLSDYRQRDWEDPAELREQLRAVEQLGADVHLVDCVQRPQSNVAITEIAPANETRAAGVPLFVDIRVKNYGRQPVQKLPVRVRTYFYDPQTVAASRPGEDIAQADDPPAGLIEEIGPGETAAARVQVFFPQPGPHLVEAWLPDDAVALDNRRWTVVDLPESEPVLIVDGSIEQRHAYFLASAFAPGQRAATGVRPEIKPASFLRDASPADLQQFRAIYLLDVPRLDDIAVQQLTEYVSAGGGLAIFVGDNVHVPFYNETFYQQGQGLFPLPLGRAATLPPERIENLPDFQVTPHPVFNVFLGERNPFVRLVSIDRYLAPDESWSPSAETPVSILATLRNGAPLVAERRLGEGRVITFLTTAAPIWNNWGHDPSYVVMLLKLQAYLAAPTRRTESRLVGSVLEVQVGNQHAPEVTFVAPSDEGSGDLVHIKMANDAAPPGEQRVARLGDGAAETGVSGAYEAWLRSLDGTPRVRRFALNVDPTEGDLAHTGSEVIQRLEPLAVAYHEADTFAYEFLDQAGSNRSLLLMGLLVLMLLGEQILAFATSYHPARGVATS